MLSTNKVLLNLSIFLTITGQAFAQSDEIRNTRNEIIKLDRTLKPSQNFDLSDWSVNIPIDSNKDGISDNIPERFVAKGFSIKPFFYTGDDGGMVFYCPTHSPKTSKSSNYARTELREMLRKGNSKIAIKGVTKNNWVLSTAKRKVRKKAGAVNGMLDATLAINNVTSTGDNKQVGRVIIGQINAEYDEPLRLYYRKLPDNERGSIYIAHEPLKGDEQWYNLIGTRSSTATDPIDGIELDEVFSYRIKVIGHNLVVTIMRQGKPDVVKSVDISKSGYNKSKQYMYFKAGAYNQNNTSDERDYAQVTFYQLDNSH